MFEVLQNVWENAQHLQGLEYVGFALTCLPGVVGIVGVIIGLYLMFKPTHMTSVADMTGVFQGLMSLVCLLGGLALIGLAYVLLTSFFGG